MKEKLNPNIEKNLYDLSHDRQLQKSHTCINLGLVIWLAFIAGIMTYVFDGDGRLNASLFFVACLGTSIIGGVFFSLYWVSKRKRIEIIEKIKKIDINPYSPSILTC